MIIDKKILLDFIELANDITVETTKPIGNIMLSSLIFSEFKSISIRDPNNSFLFKIVFNFQTKSKAHSIWITESKNYITVVNKPNIATIFTANPENKKVILNYDITKEELFQKSTIDPILTESTIFGIESIQKIYEEILEYNLDFSYIQIDINSINDVNNILSGVINNVV